MFGLYKKLLGHPFVDDQVRRRVVGGIDMKPLYSRLEGEARKVVLDVGCGTGDALVHLTDLDDHLGIDTRIVTREAA